ncbi:MAG: hypothetical protein L0Y57_03025 [Beijerinckiaceae bacterium]|nr:hypothetical protein [Beijerinckiaceae bacterium]
MRGSTLWRIFAFSGAAGFAVAVAQGARLHGGAASLASFTMWRQARANRRLLTMFPCAQKFPSQLIKEYAHVEEYCSCICHRPYRCNHRHCRINARNRFYGALPANHLLPCLNFDGACALALLLA